MFYDIRRYLTDEHFDVVWGATPRGPPKWTPQNQVFERLNLECQCFMISVDI